MLTNDAMMTPAGSTIISGGSGSNGYDGTGMGGLVGGVVLGALLGRGLNCTNDSSSGSSGTIGFLSNQMADGFAGVNGNLVTGFTQANTTSQLNGIATAVNGVGMQVATEGRMTGSAICDAVGTLTNQNFMLGNALHGTEANLTSQNFMLGSAISDQTANLTAQNFGIEKSLCELGHQGSMNTASIIASNNENTQTILTAMTNNEMQRLRDELAEKNLSSELSSRGLLTATGTAMAVIPNRCHDHGHSHDHGHNNGTQLQINNLESQVNAIGSNVTSLIGALSSQLAKQS